MVSMSILNRTNDGFAAVLIALWRTVRNLEPMSKEKLLALCAPDSISDKDAKNTLRRWTQLELFVEREGKVWLASPFDKLRTDRDVEYRSFRREVRRLAFSEKSNRDFLVPEPDGAADFSYVTAWLLSTDVFAGHFRNLASMQRFETEQVLPIGDGDSKYALQNDTRWTGFKDWAAFLGFGWNSTPFQLDPTEAIEDELDEIFDGQAELTVDEFVQRLGEKLPVLDGGQYFQRARERAATGWRPIESHQLSPALGRALLRLQCAGRLNIEARADADSRSLLGVGFASKQRVTHLGLRGDIQ